MKGSYLGLDQVLAVEVPIGPDGLVEVLLLFEFGLSFGNLLFVLKDLHLAHFDVLHVLQHLLGGQERDGERLV